MEITASVGAWEKGAKNLAPDVTVVQQLLTQAAQLLGRPEINPGGVDGAIGRPPRSSGTVKAIRAFQKQLNNAGMIAPVRRTRGDDIDAACGQLRLKTERELAKSGE